MAQKLKPICIQEMEKLRTRAVKQIEAAYPLLLAQGKGYTYNASNGDGTHTDYPDCIGCGVMIIRRKENGHLSYHHNLDMWIELEECRQVYDLCYVADHFLKLSTQVTY